MYKLIFLYITYVKITSRLISGRVEETEQFTCASFYSLEDTADLHQLPILPYQPNSRPARCTAPDSPEASGTQTPSTPGALPPRTWLATWWPPPVMHESPPLSLVLPRLCFLYGRSVSDNKAVIMYFHHPTVSSVEVSNTTPAVDNDRALLSSPESPDGLPDSLWGSLKVFFHGLNQLLPHLRSPTG